MRTLNISQAWAPPNWALLERKLIETLNRAAVEFVDRYTRPDGSLVWRNQWPGMDGSDDPYEAFMYFPVLYALGGNEEVHALSRKMWDAITWQWTEYGQIHDEFDKYYDWMHHGEGNLYYYFMGLADGNDLKNRQRAVRFAGLYTGNNPLAPNYDPDLKLMRSPFTGSLGPRFVITEEDLLTHRGVLDDYLAPFEDIPGVDFSSGKCPWSDDRTYREIIRRFNDRMTRGDVPLNLHATTLLTNAFLYTGDESYHRWVIDYLARWMERAEQQGGLLPDNVGLSGKVGEYNDGKWWGGYYGWRWPHGFYSIVEPALNAGMNAVLLTGSMPALQLARAQLDELWKLGKGQDGEFLVPYRHTDKGWTDYRRPDAIYPIYLWSVSMAQEDLDRILRIRIDPTLTEVDIPTYSGRNPKTGKRTKHYIGNTIPWFLYMRGEYPEYPKDALEANFALIHRQLEKMRSSRGDPYEWDWAHPYSIHQWQEMCPVYCEALVQLTLGGPMHISHGGLQHGRLRYFDASLRRPGLPEDVGALVEKLTDQTATLTLVNIGLFETRDVIVQAGVFGEHRFREAILYDENHRESERVLLDGKWLRLAIAPGCGVRMVLSTDRYVHTPSYDTPWSDCDQAREIIRGR